jgi:uroporphyrinogen decarboxylase
MTEAQWQTLIDIVVHRSGPQNQAAFIIDSPWLPGWHGISTLDYYTSDKLWLEANRAAIETFPEAIFLPGFWSEYGMCTEPSAFGSKMVWARADLPHARKTITDISEIGSIQKPDPRKDGLLPFMINRLALNRQSIRDMGHDIRFAVARGPLNIASFLMGTTEFMMAIAMHPEAVHRLLQTITDFTIEWIGVQKEHFDTIDGILLLDDLVGFLGEEDIKQFAVPYIKRIYGSFDVQVRFFHNDAQGLACAPFLHEIGINLFNFSHEHTLPEMRALCGPEVALLGNIPPRDVMGRGTPDDVQAHVEQAWRSIDDKSGILWSCGGGMPQDVTTENIRTFVDTLQELGR